MSAPLVPPSARSALAQDPACVRLPRLALLGALLLALYGVISRFPLWPPDAVAMPAWVPFVPALAPAYWAMLLLGWFLPLLLRSDARYAACLRACVYAFLITAGLWLLLPTTLPRPAIPAGWWNLPYHLLCTLDAPTNIRPCGHILAPVIGAWHLGHERPAWRPLLAAALLAGAAVVALTWQHRPLDILIGTLIAGAAIALAGAPGATGGGPTSVAKTEAGVANRR